MASKKELFVYVPLKDAHKRKTLLDKVERALTKETKRVRPGTYKIIIEHTNEPVDSVY